jgi:hypothetical protein
MTSDQSDSWSDPSRPEKLKPKLLNRCRKRLKMSRITRFAPHNLFFLIGFIYYLLSPPIIGMMGMFAHDPLMKRWHEMYQVFSQDFGVSKYFSIVAIFFVAFFFGVFLAKWFPVRITTYGVSQLTFRITSNLAVFLGASIFIAFAFLAPPSLSFYQDYDVGLFGAALTIQAFILYFASISTQLMNPRLTMYAVGVAAGLSLYLFISGVRIGLINAFFAWLCYRMLRRKSVSLRYITILAGAAVWIGIVRVGDSISVEKFAMYFFAEPSFTWFSAGTMFSGFKNGILWYQVPLSLLGSVVNFVPSFLLPTKADLIVGLDTLVDFSAPLGATNVLVTSIGNFGVLFFWIYPFLIGFVCQFAYQSSRNSTVAFAYYICISSTIPFQMFRDGSAIYVKQMFWNFLLLPSLFLFIGLVIVALLPTRHRPGAMQ